MLRCLSLPLAVVLVLAPWAPAQTSSFSHTVKYGTTSYVADFKQHSARGPNLSIQVQQANGAFVTHKPGAARTYIGTLRGVPGAMASALRRANGPTYYHVLFEDGAEWINSGGATQLRTHANWTPAYPSLVTGSGGAGSDVWAAEVGVDLPYSQYSVDNNVDAALEMIEHSVNTVNLIYLRDASILHRLGRVVIRANAARDPYSGMTTTKALLGELRNQWNNVLPRGTHDAGLIATSATGGGLAYVGVIGSANYCYSSNGASKEGDFTVVWRHEIGHNWSLGHYDGGTPEGRTINSGNALSRMSGAEQAKAIAHRNARTHFLDKLGPHPAPIPPRASLDRASFAPQTAHTIDVLDNDHDANGESIRIASFDTRTLLGGSVARSPGTGPGGRDELLYTPPAGIPWRPDLFRYRIVDSAGREGLGNVITRIVLDTDLLAHFAMDEGTGTTAKDSSSYLRHASLDSGPTWGAGRLGGGITFDGVDDKLVAAALDQATASFTVTGWVKRSGTQATWAGIVFCRGGGTLAGFCFGATNDLRYHWDGGHFTWNSGLVVPDNTWTFVALTVTPSAATIYMDPGTGMKSATHTVAHPVEPFDAPLTIGCDPYNNSRWFKGTLDDIRVYRRALTRSEVAAAAAGLGSAANPVPGHITSHSSNRLLLTWTSSPAAKNHRVYFSRNYSEVRDGRAAANKGLSPASFWSTPSLSYGSWYWRIDTTDGKSWAKGPVWTFKIAPSMITPLVQEYGAGCQGSNLSVPRLSTTSSPRIGAAFTFQVTAAKRSSSGAFFFAQGAAYVALGGCHLLVGSPMLPSPGVPTDANGRSALRLTIPLSSALLGERVFGQFVVKDAGGAFFGVGAMSNGLHLRIGW